MNAVNYAILGCASSRLLAQLFPIHRLSTLTGESMNGFVGGIIGVRNENGVTRKLSPAISYVDQVYNAGAISANIDSINLSPRSQGPDFFRLMFGQKTFMVSISKFLAKGFPNPASPAVKRSSLRYIIASGIRELQSRDIRRIFVDPFDDAETVAEAAYLSAFVHDELKVHSLQKVKPRVLCYFDHLPLNPHLGNRESVLRDWFRGSHLACAQNIARKWMETPPNRLSLTAFAEEVKLLLEELAGSDSVRVFIRSRAWCEEQKMNGLLAVSPSGSGNNVAFVEIIYEGDPARLPNHVALVGKGITSYSGGRSLKLNSSTCEMRADISGAAVVAATIYGLIKLRTRINVRAYIPLCQNSSGDKTIFPGDVIQFSNGLSVEVNDNESEGRLMLGDALLRAQGHSDLPCPPLAIIDVAALNDTVRFALGTSHIGAFWNFIVDKRPLSWSAMEKSRREEEHRADIDEDNNSSQDFGFNNSKRLFTGSKTLVDLLRQSSRSKGDLFWQLPFSSENPFLQSRQADLSTVPRSNAVKVNTPGYSARFLSAFVSHSIPWIHCDISGVMMVNFTDPVLQEGMSGRPTRTLIRLFDILSQT